MDFDIIIVGGSYAGLSAGLALGRSLRKVLIVDANQPCNAQTPHSHNFLTHDGDTPAQIAEKARVEVLKYPTVQLVNDTVVSAKKNGQDFIVQLKNGDVFSSRRVILATGMRDVLPDIKGFVNCWAISIIHCPYCHGYEVSGEKVALFMNGEMAFEMAKMISHWNKDLSIITNGPADFTAEQKLKLESKGIQVIEDEIIEFEHEYGKLKAVLFRNGKRIEWVAVYAKPKMEQNQMLYSQLGCTLNENGLIEVDAQHETTSKGVYAAGDCTLPYRGLSAVAASGTMAAVMLNREMISEDF
ncbi:NAD(P)/FAD-dependent oxidoreductase [Pedobacter sp. AW1-32]|uniref:NAD(P)/FAD-dependent oxidoreductase n=1 Tax=Pedobacter sp. AW1-32 TaxID=3383026 RepID=UPI003FEFDB2D